MPYTFLPQVSGKNICTFHELMKPLKQAYSNMSPLNSRGNRPLKMEFQDQLDAMIYYHLEEYKSATHLLDVLEKEDFARKVIAPENGIRKSSFSEAINTRGIEQIVHVFNTIQKQSSTILPKKYSLLGDLVAIDGSLIDAVLSMHWADYRDGCKKAKIHLGFDINRGIPRKLYLTDGKADERPFADKIIEPGQTGVMDRYYQCHKDFDLWQEKNKQFVCRIRSNTRKTVIRINSIEKNSSVFYDAIVLLGTSGTNQSKHEVRVVGYRVKNKEYWVATNRFDLKSEKIAHIYKLRWDIEKFFAWWKRHLKVYCLVARSFQGLLFQIYSGLITYLLLAIYCHEKFNERVSIKRVREIRINIRNEAQCLNLASSHKSILKKHMKEHLRAKT